MSSGMRCDGSDESSESELLDTSLSIWTGLPEDVLCPVGLDIYTAASIGQFECVNDALHKGCDVIDRRNSGGWTPLMYASYIGHECIVSLLLDAKVDCNARNPKGQTPLILAASCGNDAVGFFLLKAGAQLEARDMRGWTALFHATSAGHQNMVKFLLDNKADLNSREPNNGMTPFLEAASEGHEVIVQYFLQQGADVNFKNANGDNSHSLAFMRGHKKIASMINYHITVENRKYKLGDDNHRTDSRQRNVKEPSILDGSAAFAKIIEKQKNEDSDSAEIEQPRKRMSSDGDDDDDVFSKTGASTIKSGSGSSGGLAEALRLSRENSIESPSGGDAVSNSEVNCNDKSTVAVNYEKQQSVSHWLHESEETGGVTDLATLLQQQGLSKYQSIFAEQDVDLHVFLSLTDNDLKEIGIKLFGPRRKMTNAIARWHSNACPTYSALEHAYADKLEAEMQELAIQLQQRYEVNENLKGELLQEKELRSVTEGYLMETRSSWQIVQHVATETRQYCLEMSSALQQISHYQKEIWRRGQQSLNRDRPDSIYSNLADTLSEGMSLQTNLRHLTVEQLHSSLSYYFDEFKRTVALSAVNMEKLLGRDSEMKSAPS